MKNFITENFLLQTKTAEILYHEHTKELPIIDYHCHLDPKLIAENSSFENITRAWLCGDHYKWRAMRTNGVDEKFCTGNAPDWEKFEKWAETVPYTLRNPLYHWTHLELKRYFGISALLDGSSAKDIYGMTNEMLQSDDFSPLGMLKRMNVEVVCTTDDPIDSLESHREIAQSGKAIRVLPAWRPDKAMAIGNITNYNKYLDVLSQVSGIEINSFTSLMEALQNRHDFFHNNGCRLSDHGIENFYCEDYSPNEIDMIFKKIRSGKEASTQDLLKFKSAMLYEFGLMDHSKGWVQQFHFGPIRNNNTRMFNSVGPDTGFDSIGDFPVASAMSGFLNKLDKQNKLAKTILYNINPADNHVTASMIGNFQDGSVPGKIQWGSAWWFLDQKDGIEDHLNILSNLGLLSRFVGMLTDSRSFLSFPRHEYFRRILCNLIGNDVENGELPKDMGLLGGMVEDISYYNARRYFKF